MHLNPHELELTLEQLEVVGHHGPRFAECGECLPIVRDTQLKRATVWSAARWPNLLWEEWEQVQERALQGQITLFPQAHSLASLGTDHPPHGLLVVACSQAFYQNLSLATADAPDQAVGPTGFPPAHHLSPDYHYWILPAHRAIELLDACGRILLTRWNEAIATKPPHDPTAQRLGRLATLVCRTKSLRYQAHLRWLSARFFGEPLSSEASHRLFEILVAKQYGVDWERFRGEMAAVYEDAHLQHRIGHRLQSAVLGLSTPLMPELQQILEQLKATVLDWSNTPSTVRKWWTAFELENRERPEFTLQVAQALARRHASITDLFRASTVAQTNNPWALIHYLDYQRVKDQPVHRSGLGSSGHGSTAE